MKEEIVDEVNEKNEFIKKEEKKKCHLEGLWHRSAGVFIFNDNGNLLLQKRSMNMAVSPGKYDCSASGHVSSGETIEESAKKELKEELGIETDLKLIFKNTIENFDEGNNKIRHFYSLFVGYYNGSFNIEKSEVESIKFFDLENIRKMIRETPNKFTVGFRLFFNKYAETK